MACRELRVHCCGTLLEASEIPGEMGDGRAGVHVGMTPPALSQEGGAEEPCGVALSVTGVAVALVCPLLPHHGLPPMFAGEAQLGDSRCARQPIEPASPHLLSPPAPNFEVKF